LSRETLFLDRKGGFFEELIIGTLEKEQPEDIVLKVRIVDVIPH